MYIYRGCVIKVYFARHTKCSVVLPVTHYLPPLEVCNQFIIYNTEFIIFDTNFISSNKKSLPARAYSHRTCRSRARDIPTQATRHWERRTGSCRPRGRNSAWVLPPPAVTVRSPSGTRLRCCSWSCRLPKIHQFKYAKPSFVIQNPSVFDTKVHHSSIGYLLHCPMMSTIWHCPMMSAIWHCPMMSAIWFIYVKHGT